METPRDAMNALPVRMTLHGAARHYGVSVARLRSAVRARQLRVMRTGHLEWVTVEEMDRLLRLDQERATAPAS